MTPSNSWPQERVHGMHSPVAPKPLGKRSITPALRAHLLVYCTTCDEWTPTCRLTHCGKTFVRVRRRAEYEAHLEATSGARL